MHEQSQSSFPHQITSSHLVCSHFTITGAQPREPARFSFAEQVQAVAQAGFVGIGISGMDYAEAISNGMSARDFLEIMDDHGISPTECEFLMDWSAGRNEPERFARAKAIEEAVWRAADDLGPRVVSAGELMKEMPPTDILAERLGSLCDRAASHGLLVALEPIPWSGIPDVVAASELMHLVDRPNLGLCLDTYHYFRGTPDDEALRAVADRVYMIQICDAAAELAGDIREDALQRRRLPGDGDFDLVRVLRLLHEAGAPAPVSVEVISLEQNALCAEEAASGAYTCARKVVDKALSQAAK